MTANGNSPLDNMRTLEHYLSDIMRAGAADTPEHLKGTCPIFLYKPRVQFQAMCAQRATETCLSSDVGSKLSCVALISGFTDAFRIKRNV